MKKSSKIKTLTVLFAVAILSLTFFASCNVSDVQKLIDNNISNVTPTKLDTPTNIELGSDDILRWNKTENASSYVVNIDGVNYSTSVPSLNLAKTLKENGEYEAYIKALSDRSGYVDSEFSAPYKFTFNGIKLIEDGNKTSGMFGLFDDLYTKEAYIGYGYDVIGSSYVNSDEVKMNYRIFDQDKLTCVLREESEGEYIRHLVIFSFFIVFVVLLIVLIIISEGDGIDGVDAIPDGNKNKKRKH